MTAAQLPADDWPGLYVHMPFCEGKCAYCGFYSEPVAGHDPHRLISALVSELDDYRDVPAPRTVYVGGGSPTSLGAASLRQLLEALAAVSAESGEWTVECNPG